MREISMSETALISAGTAAANAAADKEIGTAIGRAWHGLTSKEARAGIFIGSPIAVIYGAVKHFKSHH